MIMTAQRLDYVKGDCVFHPVHGQCRVKKIIHKPDLGKEGLYYCLEPKRKPNVGTRFFIPVGQMRDSGFHEVISREEAKLVFEYLKCGSDSFLMAARNSESKHYPGDFRRAWDFAQMLVHYGCSKDHDITSDDRKRFKSAAEALSRELAIVLKTPADRIVVMLQNCLRRYLEKNSWQNNILERLK